MGHLDDASTYEKLDLNIYIKIHKKFEKAFTQYFFTESEQKFLTEKSFETSNSYGLPKINKSKVIKAAIHSQSTDLLKVLKPSNLKLRLINGR